MKKTMVFSLLTLMVFGVLISTGLVSAYRGDYSVEGPNYDVDRHELMNNAFDNLDYNAWYDLMTQDGFHPRVVDVVTESNFEIFAKAHNAGKSGDYVLATSLRNELGLNNGNGLRDGSGQSHKMNQGKNIQKINFIDSDNDGTCDNFGLIRNRK